MLLKHQWKIAFLTLIVVSSSVWFLKSSTSEITMGTIVMILLSPFYALAGIKVVSRISTSWQVFRKTGHFPPNNDGSPTGNKIALVLAGLIVLLIIFVVIKGAMQ